MRRINYLGMYERIYSRPRAVSAMKHIHALAVIFVVLSFVTYVAFAAWVVSLRRALILLAVSGAPFVIVSVARRLIGRPRPYEVHDFSALGIEPPRQRGMDSLPSRHTFSAFLIGSLILFDMPLLGSSVLVIGIYLAAARVLLGYHFISDVISGAIIGTVAGVVGAICVAVF